MIVCPSCGKENQELYKFCLGCGGDLTGGEPAVPRSSKEAKTADAPRKTGPGPATAPPVFSEMGPAKPTNPDMQAARPMEPTPPKFQNPAPTSDRRCSACSHEVPPSFQFCANCGARYSPAPPKAAPKARVSSGSVTSGRLILVRPDGTEGGAHPLVEGENLIGRSAGTLFEADGYLSPRHAALVVNAAGLAVRDAGSLNGVFVKITAEEELQDGDIFRIGQELLRFDVIPAPEPLEDGTEILGSPNPGFWGRLAVIVGPEQDASAHPLFGDAIILGRERGDITFPEDGYVSGTHARVAYNDGRCYLNDLNSSNGTFIRVRGERQLGAGAYLLLGQQLFRVVL